MESFSAATCCAWAKTDSIEPGPPRRNDLAREGEHQIVAVGGEAVLGDPGREPVAEAKNVEECSSIRRSAEGERLLAGVVEDAGSDANLLPLRT